MRSEPKKVTFRKFLEYRKLDLEMKKIEFKFAAACTTEFFRVTYRKNWFGLIRVAQEKICTVEYQNSGGKIYRTIEIDDAHLFLDLKPFLFDYERVSGEEFVILTNPYYG